MEARVKASVVGILLVIFVFVYRNSSLYYAKELCEAIDDGNAQYVAEIIEKKPASISTYPSLAPKWWQSAMNTRYNYPLTYACLKGNDEIIRLLVEGGADVNCNDGYTPLSAVLRFKQGDWYKNALYLIENGASLYYETDYSGSEFYILNDVLYARSYDCASEYGKENDVEILMFFEFALSHCHQEQFNWARVLSTSVTYDRTEVIHILLENGFCNVNDTVGGMTALMFAARDSNVDTVNLLLDYGADPDILSSDGYTALDYAIQREHPEIIALLIEAD